MKFQTSITDIREDGEYIRGIALETLVKGHSFAQSVFHILQGRLPNESEGRMMDALLISSIDHSVNTSALNARVSVSAKNPLNASLAAGLLGFGQRHGLATGMAMQFFLENESTKNLKQLLLSLKEQKIRVPGFGHKVFTDRDPRSETLFAIAQENGVLGKYSQFAKQVQGELSAISSKPLPFNIDGVIAAILCDMGFTPDQGDAIFIIGRVPGLLAHVIEEKHSDAGIRRLSEEDIEYSGK
ncbi:citryl-CoA lyase [Candidatus Nomurabacteria bacterium]|nr:citryl-CoA lyase [Candidatus Nomurabacteria bacterium]